MFIKTSVDNARMDRHDHNIIARSLGGHLAAEVPCKKDLCSLGVTIRGFRGVELAVMGDRDEVLHR